jgi:4'-phosphopantetheinyl transferase
MAEVKTRLYLGDVRALFRSEFLEKVSKSLSEERQNKIARLTTEKARALSAGSEMLLQTAIRETFGISGPLRFTKGPFGKPLLAEYPHIHFNLSHSGYYAVCALGCEPVGVDLQMIGALKMKLARRFFSEEELCWLESLPKEKQIRGFYDLWAIKESYMKYTGLGFHLPLASFVVKISESYPDAGTVSIVRKNEIQEVSVTAFEGFEEFVLWSCSRHGHFEKKLRFVDLKEQVSE